MLRWGLPQLVGKDLHVTAVLGQKQLEEQADDLGLDTQWTSEAAAPTTVGPHPGSSVCPKSLSCHAEETRDE